MPKLLQLSQIYEDRWKRKRTSLEVLSSVTVELASISRQRLYIHVASFRHFQPPPPPQPLQGSYVVFLGSCDHSETMEQVSRCPFFLAKALQHLYGTHVIECCHVCQDDRAGSLDKCPKAVISEPVCSSRTKKPVQWSKIFVIPQKSS